MEQKFLPSSLLCTVSFGTILAANWIFGSSGTVLFEIKTTFWNSILGWYEILENFIPPESPKTSSWWEVLFAFNCPTCRFESKTLTSAEISQMHLVWNSREFHTRQAFEKKQQLLRNSGAIANQIIGSFEVGNSWHSIAYPQGPQIETGGQKWELGKQKKHPTVR